MEPAPKQEDMHAFEMDSKGDHQPQSLPTSVLSAKSNVEEKKDGDSDSIPQAVPMTIDLDVPIPCTLDLYANSDYIPRKLERENARKFN